MKRAAIPPSFEKKECLSSRVRKGQLEGRKGKEKDLQPPLPPTQICLERVFEPRASFFLVSNPPTPSSPYGGTHAQNGIDKTFAYSQSGVRRGCVTER